MELLQHVLIGICCFIGIFEISYGKLPSSVITCSRNHPEPEKCIIEAVEHIRPLLAKGDLGDGFRAPPLEPLYLDNIEMGRGEEFKAIFSDIEAHGGSNFKVEKLKANITNLTFDVSVLLPRIDFNGKYSLKIRLLLLNINGNGTVRGTFKNARGAVKLRGYKIKKDDMEFVKFKELPLKIKVEDAKFHLDNLFNGDPILGQVGNTVINDNYRLFLAETLPGLEKSLSKTFLNIANNILVGATFDDLFPLE